MGTIKDVLSAMREVLVLTDKVEQVGGVLKDLAQEVRGQDRRLVRLETMIEIVGNKEIGLPGRSNK